MSSFNSRSPPGALGGLAWGQAFSGHSSCGCGSSGSIIDNTPGSSEAFLAASHLAGSEAREPQGLAARELTQHNAPLSAAWLGWEPTSHPVAPPLPLEAAPPLAGAAPGPNECWLLSCPGPGLWRGESSGNREYGPLMVSQRTLSSFQPPQELPRT